MNVYALGLLVFVSLLTNIFYKARTFERIDWNGSLLLTLWFLLGSLVLWMFSQQYLVIQSTFFPLFFCVSLCWFLWPFVIKKIGLYPSSYLKYNPSRFLVKFEPKITLIKYSEVVHQQVGFLFLCFVVVTATVIWHKILIITGVIVLLHVANYFVMTRKWATFYLILSIPMGILFSFLILSGHIFLTASIHLLFYIVHNSLYWLKRTSE